MAGDLKVGGVFATFTADTAEWVKGLDKALKSTADFLKKVEGISGKLGGLGAMISGTLGLSIAALKDSTPEAAAAFEAVSTSASVLSRELISAALPAIKEISSAVIGVTESLRKMDPELKSQIASVAVWSSGMLLAVGVIGKLTGAVAATVEGMRLLTPAFTAIASVGLGPVLAVVAAVAALAVTAAVVVEAWSDTSTGFKEALLDMWKAVKSFAGKLGELFVDIGKFIGSIFGEVFDGLTDALAEVIRAVATAAGTIAEALPDSLVPKQAKDVLVNLSNLTGKQLRSDLGTAAGVVARGFKTGAEFVIDGVKTSVEFAGRGFGRIADNFSAKMKELFPGGKLPGADGGGGDEIPESLRDWGKKTAESAKATGNSTRTMGDLIVSLKDITKAQTARGMGNPLGVAGGILGGAATGGAIGGVINAGMEGAAMGGPAGAIAAVAAELLTMSETFATALTMVTNFLGNIANILGNALAPVLNALGPIFQIVESIVGAVLTPILTAVAETLEGFAPIFQVLNVLFQGLAPLIQFIVMAMNPLTMQLKMFKPALELLFEVVKFISGVILEVSKFIAGIINGIISVVQEIFRKLADINIFGLGKPLAFLNDWAEELEESKISVKEMTVAQDDLKDMTYESAAAEAERISATYKATEAVKSFSDSLTNVPEGFKLALRRFTADVGIEAPDMTTAGVVPTSVPPPPVVDNSTNTVTINLPAPVLENVEDVRTLAQILSDEIAEANQRRLGNMLGNDSLRWAAEP